MRIPAANVLLLAAGLGGLLGGCADSRQRAAVLWTDRPEFTLYAELFNTSQSEYKVEVRYFESPAQKLTEGGERPDLAAACWLRGASTRDLFSPLEPLFKKGLPAEAFYPRLLSLGGIEGRQYLLPVSFNLPALVFPQAYGSALSNPLTISLAEIQEKGRAYNRFSRGQYTRMGFSPAWDDSFLYITAALYNASFREDSPLSWNQKALDEAMDYAHDWTAQSNSGLQAEDDFVFKYLYDPPATLVLSGRILFAYMGSARLFTLAEDRRAGLDFRWVSENALIPLDEQSVYMGICKKAKAPDAARAFVLWFFQDDTQRAILAFSRANRMDENAFGIAGGFSGMRSVTEQVFPQFYQGLIGRMPPEAFLSPPAILPHTWTAMKERVILPYLRDRARASGGEGVQPLERRLAEWVRVNKG
ncbi:MAG: hypothetical protein LBR16_04550 [Treponema sp.]|jgi:hypothetical protein|nr:hypothetical protein [Treponema sp.]